MSAAPVSFSSVTPGPQAGVPAVLLLPGSSLYGESHSAQHTPCVCSQLPEWGYTALSSYSVLLFMTRDAGILHSSILQANI